MLVLEDVLYVVKTMFFGGGKSSSQTSTLQTLTRIIHIMNIYLLILSK